VSVNDALTYVAGYTIVADVSLPHDSFYRPSIRFKARDGFCPIGPVMPASAVAHPNALGVRVYLDGQLAQATTTAGRVRAAAQLLAAVTDFMTLQPGDILMLGVSAGAPQARAGQRVAIEIDGLGRLENTVVAEEVAA
jgi:5-oxopent-3-ene-1,2,5-tricarboxylate decarboxylase/2-hydroxyhepta-2,4-diene-1,7-dioate isomerase